MERFRGEQQISINFFIWNLLVIAFNTITKNNRANKCAR